MLITVNQNSKIGERIDIFVLSQLKQNDSKYIPSRSFLQEIFGNVVTVNDEISKHSYRIREGDIVMIDEERIGEEMERISSNFEIKSQSGDLHILGQTSQYLVVEKPKGMVVHPGVGNSEDTLVNFVKGYLEEKGEFDSKLSRVGLVHRLDKGVSGIMIFAKTLESQRSLQKQFEEHTVKKIYLAKVQGGCVLKINKTSIKKELDILEKSDFKLDDSWYKAQGYIGRSRNNRIKMEFKETKFPNSKKAISYLKRINTDEVLVDIITGRMHQIRATLEHLGVSIKGDTLYGDKSKSKIPNEIDLQSILISFEDLDGKRITFRKY